MYTLAYICRPKKCAQCAPPLLALGNGQDHKVAAQCARHEAPTVSPTSLPCAQLVHRRRLQTETYYQSKLHGIAE